MRDSNHMATYNYCSPMLKDDSNVPEEIIVGSWIGHFFVDMIPYYATGNSNTREQYEEYILRRTYEMYLYGF